MVGSRQVIVVTEERGKMGICRKVHAKGRDEGDEGEVEGEGPCVLCRRDFGTSHEHTIICDSREHQRLLHPSVNSYLLNQPSGP